MKARTHLISIVLAVGVGVAALGMGIGSGFDFLKRSQAEVGRREAELLRNENKGKVQAFWSTVDRLRAEALQVGLAPPSTALPSSMVYWAQLKTENGRAVVEAKRTSAGVSSVEEAAWISEMQLRVEQWGSRLEKSGPGMIRFRPETLSYREWMGLAFPVAGEAGKVQIVAILPQKTFMAATQAAAGKSRFYLMGTDGTVIAHSQAGYAGARFSQSTFYKEAIDPTLQGKRRDGVGEFEAFDSLRVRAAYARVGELPLVWVSEEVIPRGSASAWSGNAVRFSMALLLILSVGVVLALVFSLRTVRVALGREAIAPKARDPRARSARDQEEATPMVRPVLARANAQVITVPHSASPLRAGMMSAGPVVESSRAESVVGFGDTVATDEALASRQAIQSFAEEKEILAEFDDAIFHLKHPDVATEKLVQSVSQLCVSPVLFFQHQDSLKVAQLRFDAGFSSGSAPVEMSFPIDSDFLARLTQVAVSGEAEAGDQMKRMLTSYPGLTKIILLRLGIAHFEAWPVFRYSPLGRAAGRPRLHGVLIVLQAGEVAYRRGQSIGRMIQSAALVYENSMSSQNL